MIAKITRIDFGWARSPKGISFLPVEDNIESLYCDEYYVYFPSGNPLQIWVVAYEGTDCQSFVILGFKKSWIYNPTEDDYGLTDEEIIGRALDAYLASGRRS
jgi:hypothetical protein